MSDPTITGTGTGSATTQVSDDSLQIDSSSYDQFMTDELKQSFQIQEMVAKDTLQAQMDSKVFSKVTQTIGSIIQGM